jgi:hypothetical protein
MKNLRIELLLHVHRLKYSIGIIAIETSVTLQLEQKLDTNRQKTYSNNKFKKLPKQEGMKMQALSSHFLNFISIFLGKKTIYIKGPIKNLFSKNL